MTKFEQINALEKLIELIKKGEVNMLTFDMRLDCHSIGVDKDDFMVYANTGHQTLTIQIYNKKCDNREEQWRKVR